MKTEALRNFIGVLKNRLAGHENSLSTLEAQAISNNTTVNDLLKAIPQAHINDLEFVIDELEKILEVD
jgi:hypothetical protein